MKRRNPFNDALAILSVLVISFCSCKKSGSDGTKPQTVTLPTISTAVVSAVTQTSAVSGGTISNNGGASITARGVCWVAEPAPTPTIANSKTSDGTGTGSFTSSLTGLTGDAEYFIRAYATNSAGTAYGNIIAVFINSVPILTTSVIVPLRSNTAEFDSFVTASGSVDPSIAITARGVCWGTAPNPTITNSITADGKGVGEFVSNISGLTVNTTYYERAYATSSIGTGYSPQVSFTTAYQIGQSFEGGLIFYIDATKIHGLIVSPADQSTSYPWSNSYVSANAFSTTDGAGNTTNIIRTFGSATAAGICQAYRGGGYNDWFLPALSQLNTLAGQAVTLYPTMTIAGALSANGYWSSTEYSGYVAFAYYESLYGAQYNYAFKDAGYSVRAIRAF